MQPLSVLQHDTGLLAKKRGQEERRNSWWRPEPKSESAAFSLSDIASLAVPNHAREARSSLLLKRNAVRGGHLPDSSGALCVCLPIRQVLHYQGNVGVEPGHAAKKGVVIQVPGTGRNLFHRHD